MKSAIALISFLFAAVCAAEERTNFAYSAPITLERGESVYEATLTADTYRHAAYGDLRDLRVFNGSGEVVPFNLREPVRAVGSRSALVPVPIFPLRGDATKALDALRVTIVRENGNVKIDTGARASRADSLLGYLVDLRELKDSVVAAEFSWDDDTPEFSSAVTLAVSDDLSVWRTIVGNASVVNLKFAGQRLQQHRVEFPAARAKFLRIGFIGASDMTLAGVSVEPMTAFVDTFRVQSESIGSATTSATDFQFDLGLQAPIDRVNVHLPQENSAVQATLRSRPTLESPWHVVGETTFFRLRRDEREIGNQPFRIAANSDRYWQLSIANKGTLGDGMPRLRFEWVPAQLIFVARGEPPFSVSIGNNLAARGETSLDAIVSRTPGDVGAKQIVPSIARIGDYEVVGGVAKLSQSAPVNWKNWTLWSVLVIAVAILAFMARRLLREMSDKS